PHMRIGHALERPRIHAQLMSGSWRVCSNLILTSWTLSRSMNWNVSLTLIAQTMAIRNTWSS
ncbi:hypothetical protein BGZ89_005237, partial [Linnemannia elongata]